MGVWVGVRVGCVVGDVDGDGVGVGCTLGEGVGVVCGVVSSFMLVKTLCGASSLPTLSTLQYSSLLFKPLTVICGCPFAFTVFVSPSLIL